MFKTIKANYSAEIVEKKSKFIANLFYVESIEEAEEKIKEIIQKLGATTMKDMGKVMKQAKEEIGVAADGKTINEVVKSMLG